MRKLDKYIYQYGMIVLLSVLLLFFVVKETTRAETGKALASYCVSEEEWRNLLSEKQEAESLLSGGETGLCLDGVKLPMTTEDTLFYISQPMQYGSWSGNLEAFGGDIYILSDGYEDRLPEAIREGHIFQALFVRGDICQKAGIVLTGMPVAVITTEYSEEREYPIEEIDNYVFNSETRYYGDIVIFQSGSSALPDGNKRGDYKILQRRVCYHERGKTSSIFDKKSYSVKLLNHQGESVGESLLGMKASKNWKMIPMYTDVSKIRDKTSLQIWEEMAETEDVCNEKSAQMEYCEVILDGSYRGIYGLLLPVDEDALQLGKKDILYKILDWAMPEPVDVQESIDANYEVAYPIRIRYPKKGNSVESLWKPMWDYLACKYWNMDLETYYDMTYTENLADYYIFNQVVAGQDNYLKNTYVVAKPSDNRMGYKMITLPWDLNYTFGDGYTYEGKILYTAFNPDATVNYVEPVTEQLFRSSLHGEADILKEKWAFYRQDILTEEHIAELMQANMDYMVETGAFERECNTWTEVKNSSDLSQIKEYVNNRMAYLDEYFGNF